MIFDPEHIDMIMQGTKTQTRRKSNKYEIGKSYAIQPGRGKPDIVGARIKVTNKRRERLGGRPSSGYTCRVAECPIFHGFKRWNKTSSDVYRDSLSAIALHGEYGDQIKGVSRI